MAKLKNLRKQEARLLDKFEKSQWTHRWTQEMFMVHEMFRRNLQREGAVDETVREYVKAVWAAGAGK